MANNPIRYTDRTLFDFKSRLIGGGARPNLFECELSLPNLGDLNITTSETDLQYDLRFFIKAAQLPASNIGTIPIPFRGRTLKVAGDRTIDPWTITVINDTTFNLRDLFEKWSNYINRLDDNSGVITPSVYQRDIKIFQLSRGKEASTGNTTTQSRGAIGENINRLRAYKLYGCYPSAVDAIPLSYDTTDSIEEFNVTFEVQWWDAINPATDVSYFSTVETATNPAATATFNRANP